MVLHSAVGLPRLSSELTVSHQESTLAGVIGAGVTRTAGDRKCHRCGRPRLPSARRTHTDFRRTERLALSSSWSSSANGPPSTNGHPPGSWRKAFDVECGPGWPHRRISRHSDSARTMRTGCRSQPATGRAAATDGASARRRPDRSESRWARAVATASTRVELGAVMTASCTERAIRCMGASIAGPPLDRIGSAQSAPLEHQSAPTTGLRHPTTGRVASRRVDDGARGGMT